jgi:hypothetical protein
MVANAMLEGSLYLSNAEQVASHIGVSRFVRCVSVSSAAFVWCDFSLPSMPCPHTPLPLVVLRLLFLFSVPFSFCSFYLSALLRLSFILP